LEILERNRVFYYGLLIPKLIGDFREEEGFYYGLLIPKLIGDFREEEEGEENMYSATPHPSISPQYLLKYILNIYYNILLQYYTFNRRSEMSDKLIY